MSGIIRLFLLFTSLYFSLFYPSLITHAADSSSSSDKEDVQKLDEYVVSDTQLPGIDKRVVAVPSKITVITGHDIEQSGAQTTQEAIQFATGIIFYNQNGNNFEQVISLRGFNGDPVPTVTVFVDGMRINEPDFNTINWSFIPVETIDKIEILPGPSALFGKNALSGVIKITTKRGGPERQVSAEAFFGSFQRERYNVNTSGPAGKMFDYFASFTREIEDGYRDESDARISRIFGKLGFKPFAGTDVEFSYTYVKNRLLQAGILVLAQAEATPAANDSPGDFIDNETNTVRINGRQELPFGIIATANGFYRQLGQQIFTVGRSADTANRLTKTEVRGASFQLTQQMKLSKVQNVMVFGGEFVRNDIGTRSLEVFPGFGATPGNTSKDEDVVGFYFQDTVTPITQLVLTGGVRYDHSQVNFSDNLAPANNASKRFNRVTPKAGITFLFDPKKSLYFSYSDGFRVPTLDEIFAQIGLSNPNLKPVLSQNYEFGFKSNLGSFGTLNLSFYQSDVKNEIFFTCTVCVFGSPGFDGINRNIEKARRRGVEATLTAVLNPQVDGVLNYTFSEAQFRTATTVSVGGTLNTIDIGDSFPLVPKHRLSLTGNYHPLPEITLSMTGMYVSTQFLLNDNGNAQPRVPGYVVINARAAYERTVPGGRLKAFLTINNLFDNEYFTYGIFGTGSGRNFVPAQPFSLYGGLTYQFEAFPE